MTKFGSRYNNAPSPDCKSYNGGHSEFVWQGKGTRMQQSIIDKSARCRRGFFLPWPKRLPGSMGADRPRGNGCAVLTKTYVLYRAPLRLGARNLPAIRLSAILSARGGVPLVYASCLVFISFAHAKLYWHAAPVVPLAAAAIGFGRQWLACRSFGKLAAGAEEESLQSARRRQSR